MDGSSAPHTFESLTPRETEVMTWVAHGKTRGEISVILSISEETIKNYIEKSCRKLNAVNKTQAASIAISLGVISPYHHLRSSTYLEHK